MSIWISVIKRVNFFNCSSITLHRVFPTGTNFFLNDMIGYRCGATGEIVTGGSLSMSPTRVPPSFHRIRHDSQAVPVRMSFVSIRGIRLRGREPKKRKGKGNRPNLYCIALKALTPQMKIWKMLHLPRSWRSPTIDQDWRGCECTKQQMK